MRYKNRKTGCVANVRDDKRMDADWEPIGKGSKAEAKKRDGIDGMTVSELEAFAAELGTNVTGFKLKADKIEAIKQYQAALEAAAAVAVDADGGDSGDLADDDHAADGDGKGADAKGE